MGRPDPCSDCGRALLGTACASSARSSPGWRARVGPAVLETAELVSGLARRPGARARVPPGPPETPAYAVTKSRHLSASRSAVCRWMATGKEALEAASTEVRPGPGAEAPRVARNRTLPLASGRGVRGWGGLRWFGGVVEVRGPAACLRRDALFRRCLLVADVVAIVGAFLLTVGVSRGSVQLTWAGVAAVPILVVGAKLTGLYDRDETLLRKTTLDEAPRLFQLATLCALVAWLTGGLLVRGALDRREALFLWLALSVGLVLARAASRVLALRLAPAERCLFIGDEVSAETIRSKLTGHGGVKAEVVAHLDLDKVASWSTDSFSEVRLAEIRDLAQTLDVHRAIIAPRSVDGGEMLNLVRTLKAVGVRVSVLPRLLEVVGSSVEFDDLHGVTVMGVRRFELTRSSAAFKRGFDLLGASWGCWRSRRCCWCSRCW